MGVRHVKGVFAAYGPVVWMRCCLRAVRCENTLNIARCSPHIGQSVNKTRLRDLSIFCQRRRLLDLVPGDRLVTGARKVTETVVSFPVTGMMGALNAETARSAGGIIRT
jgi:hypothetical protein